MTTQRLYRRLFLSAKIFLFKLITDIEYTRNSHRKVLSYE